MHVSRCRLLEANSLERMVRAARRWSISRISECQHFITQRQVDVCTFQPESWQSAQVRANWSWAFGPEFADQTPKDNLSLRKESGGFPGIPTFPWWFFSECLPWMIKSFRHILSIKWWYGHQKGSVRRRKMYIRGSAPHLKDAESQYIQV